MNETENNVLLRMIIKRTLLLAIITFCSTKQKIMLILVTQVLFIIKVIFTFIICYMFWPFKVIIRCK